LATSPKTPPSAVRAVSEVRRIAQLAERSALFHAQRWFVRERSWINDRQLQLCRIPAPTFFEQQRAEWFRERLTELGWEAKLDRAGNVIAARRGNGSPPALIVSAHLDTVIAPKRPEEVYFSPDGRLIGPGSSDNGAGLAALLALARVLNETPELAQLASSLMLVANVGEEGEGNLSGMRFLCKQVAQIRAFLVLDGPSTDHITAQALASRRFEISFAGPGGHSWNDYGTPNPVHAIGDVISTFSQLADTRLETERRTRCSYNFGMVEGGTSVNSIPASARAKLDLRSEEPQLLDEIAALATSAVERSLERVNRDVKTERLTAKIKELGSRPGGKLAEDAPLLRTLEAVDSYLNIRARVDCASTDANVPLSMGMPAVSIGAGGQGGGAHTNQEWYRPDTRDLGLRRILLALAALSEESSASEAAG